MRRAQDPQPGFGSVGIEEIKLNPKSRNDIPAILLSLQHLYADVDLHECSPDRGFHSPANLLRLDALLEHNVLPRKGHLNRTDRPRQADLVFVAARRQPPEVASVIHNLEQRGLDWVRAYSTDGFARVVAFSVLAFNLHRLGLLLWCRAPRRTAAWRRGRRNPRKGTCPQVGPTHLLGWPRGRAPASQHGRIRPDEALQELNSPRVTVPVDPALHGSMLNAGFSGEHYVIVGWQKPLVEDQRPGGAGFDPRAANRPRIRRGSYWGPIAVLSRALFRRPPS